MSNSRRNRVATTPPPGFTSGYAYDASPNVSCRRFRPSASMLHKFVGGKYQMVAPWLELKTRRSPVAAQVIPSIERTVLRDLARLSPAGRDHEDFVRVRNPALIRNQSGHLVTNAASGSSTRVGVARSFSDWTPSRADTASSMPAVDQPWKDNPGAIVADVRPAHTARDAARRAAQGRDFPNSTRTVAVGCWRVIENRRRIGRPPGIKMVGGIVRELKRAAPGDQANEELQVVRPHARRMRRPGCPGTGPGTPPSLAHP